MALQSSGAITLAQVQSEFGGSNPININEYYRGGSYVPNSSANSGIPTSGAIDMADFYGGTALSADNNFSFTMQSYTTGSGKLAFNHYGANGSVSDSSIVTNNLNSYTISDMSKIQGVAFTYIVTFAGTANGYNAYTTGGIRGININGTVMTFNAPSTGQTNLALPATSPGGSFGDWATIQDAHGSGNVGSSVTLTFTY